MTGRNKRIDRGLHVTGMDIMPAMLERARALSQQLPIAWVQADCRTFNLAQQFRCVLMTGHAFQNLLTDADQHAFLARASDHIAAGGTLAFDTRNLHGKTYGNTSDYTLWRSFQDQTERWIDVWVASQFDAQMMLDHVQLVRKVRETGETWPSQIALRYIGVEELTRRLTAHGFMVVAQYGDWSKTPYVLSSPEIITVCRRAALHDTASQA
jgi:SAM-dependent methyltransferase